MYSYKSDIGLLREKNEDMAIVMTNEHNDCFMMVFDGMGGHKHGEVASSLAEQYMIKAFKQKTKFTNKIDMYLWLKGIIRKMNKYLNEYANMSDINRGMGTTFACFLIHKDITLMCYIGDTRCYLIKNGNIEQKSVDETYVHFLYETGSISYEEMEHHPSKNIITNALGCYPTVIINLKFIKNDYDGLLLCSDGLYNMVNNQTISQIISNNDDLNKCTDCLIDEANKNGGKDNIAVAIMMKEAI